MKVNIYETVDISDEQRKRIAEMLGQKTATRDDLKAFVWQHGSDWELVLVDAANGDPYPVVEDEALEDLI